MQAQQEPLPECELLSPRGLFLITEDELSVASHISEALQQRGVKTAMIATSILRSPEQLASVVAEYRQLYGPVTGILHLAPLAAIPMPVTLSDWRQYTQIQSKSLFQLLQLCAEDLQQAGQQQQGRVLAASLFGGHFGRDSRSGDGLPTGGSNTGLLKTLITESPGVHAKAIDFDSTLSPADMAQHIIHELLLPGGRIEVGYPQGNRTIFKTVPAPLQKEEGERGGEGERERRRSSQLKPRTRHNTSPSLVGLNAPEESSEIHPLTPSPPHPLIPSADWVVLVTGGARGITAEITDELIVPGMTLIVVGRSPEPAQESPATAGIDIREVRQVLLEQARTQGLLATPMQIERQLKKLFCDRAIRRNLNRFRQAGTRVEYLPVDVRNSDEFGLLIDGIYQRHGRLDVVIHGSGIIEDKLIIDKTLASFDRVFDTKVDSTFILSRYLRPDSLKALVLFSSIAGRYGNRGQADYAAANEVMNRLAWQLDKRWSNTRVVSINWGPWDTIGMASEGVKRQLRERGIIPIPLAAGRQFFIDELHDSCKGETEVIAGEGPWEADEARQGQLKSSRGAGGVGKSVEEIASVSVLSNSQVELSVNPSQKFVFVSSQPQLQPDSTVTLEHTFSLSSDPYLSDYCIDGKPVLSSAVILEWMAEFIQSAWPEWMVAEVRDLKVLQPSALEITVYKKLLFSARASSHADAESLQVAVEVLDSDLKIPLYRAYIILKPKLDEPVTIPSVSLSSGISLDKAIAYRDYLFQGSRFQLLKSIDRLNEQGIDALVIPSEPFTWMSSQYYSEHSTPSWLFDPGLIDIAAQLVMVWSQSQQGTSAFPSRFGAVTRYGNSSLKGALKIAFRVTSIQENYSFGSEAVFLDENSNIRFHIQNIESTFTFNSSGSHL
jgi:NAD(P)-dependent dehydrogenase (short-subunit alcohol dehydrogenase family)